MLMDQVFYKGEGGMKSHTVLYCDYDEQVTAYHKNHCHQYEHFRSSTPWLQLHLPLLYQRLKLLIPLPTTDGLLCVR